MIEARVAWGASGTSKMVGIKHKNTQCRGIVKKGFIAVPDIVSRILPNVITEAADKKRRREYIGY